MHICSDENTEGHTEHDTDDDQARILATSFKPSDDVHAPSTTTANPMTTFDNPVYAATKGRGIPTVVYDTEFEKEDLAMIGKPLYEDDIEL